MRPRAAITAFYLVAAACLALPGEQARAVQLSQDGAGQVLLFPVVAQGARYDTLLSLTNRDAERPTLLRVTVRDGTDGTARARLNVFLGAGDTFTAALDGQALRPTDGTCYASKPVPSGSGAVNLSLEGTAFLEVIEMATVQPGTATAGQVNAPDGKCTAVRRAVEERQALGELEPPRGRVAGSVTLVDVPMGLSFSLAPTILDRFRASPLYETVDSVSPNLGDAEPAQSVLFGHFLPGGEASGTLTSTWEHPVDAVSAVLMADTLSTDFNVESGVAGNTDFLLTFPTRHYYQGASPEGARPPFVTRYVRDPHNADPIETPGQQFLLVARNREGDTVIETYGTKCTPVRVNPYPGPLLTGSQLNLRVGTEAVIPGMAVHQAVQVSTPDICASIHPTPVHEIMASGTIELDFGPFSMTSLEGHVHHGLPVVGTSLTAFANETSTLANYGVVNSVRRGGDVTYRVSAQGPANRLLSSDRERTAPSRPDIASDGSRIAWRTDVPLVPADTEDGDLEKIGHEDVYLFRAGTDTPELVTPNQSEYPEDVHIFDLSDDGQVLAYTVCEWIPDTPQTGHCEAEVRVHALATGDIRTIAPLPGPVSTSTIPVVSADGGVIAFTTGEGRPARLHVHDRPTGVTTLLTDDAKWLFDMTADGNHVLFSRGPHTFGGPPDELLLANTSTGALQSVLPPDLAERLDAPGSDMRIDDAVLSSSGRHVAFASIGDVHGTFWYDRQNDVLERLALGHRDFRMNRGLAISDDGQTVLFATAERLVPGLPPNVSQVYRWRAGGGTSLASLAPDGFSANDDAWYPASDGNAESLVFATAATNIRQPASVPGNPDYPSFHLIRVNWGASSR